MMGALAEPHHLGLSVLGSGRPPWRESIKLKYMFSHPEQSCNFRTCYLYALFRQVETAKGCSNLMVEVDNTAEQVAVLL